MSHNNSDKEFYYALYIKFYREQFEKILNVKLEDIELEKNFNGRKVDLYSTLSDGRQLFVELQLSKSDNIHLEQITKIIKSKELNNVMVVWIATGFKPGMLNEVEKRINKYCKNIYFVALKLNKRLIYYLNLLNNTFINKVTENLKILNRVENHFKIIEIFYKLQNEGSMICNRKQEEVFDLNKKQDVMKYILKELRRQVSYYPSVYRDKVITNNVIVLAGGKAAINYFIGLNRKNILFFEIRFGEKQKNLFQAFLEKEEEISGKLDHLSEFNIQNRKIGTYLYFSNDKQKMLIKQIVRIADKYIKCFSKYTFPNVKVKGYL